ncbi:MAG: hypothetical protein KC933_09690 [Myxococcales bacterium]|nr:hypothetical protein [Myxococcales bacterium]
MARPIHPLVQTAMHALTETPDGGVAVLPGGLDRVSEHLSRYFEQDDLPTAVRELLAFALYVGEGLGERALGLALMERASEATAALERLALRGDVRASDARKAAAALTTGHEELKRAPRIGEQRREGSVSLASILSGLPGKRRG